MHKVMKHFSHSVGASKQKKFRIVRTHVEPDNEISELALVGAGPNIPDNARVAAQPGHVSKVESEILRVRISIDQQDRSLVARVGHGLVEILPAGAGKATGRKAQELSILVTIPDAAVGNLKFLV